MVSTGGWSPPSAASSSGMGGVVVAVVDGATVVGDVGSAGVSPPDEAVVAGGVAGGSGSGSGVASPSGSVAAGSPGPQSARLMQVRDPALPRPPSWPVPDPPPSAGEVGGSSVAGLSRSERAGTTTVATMPVVAAAAVTPTATAVGA